MLQVLNIDSSEKACMVYMNEYLSLNIWTELDLKNIFIGLGAPEKNMITHLPAMQRYSPAVAALSSRPLEYNEGFHF